MLPTPPQSDAAAGEIEEFHNWAGRGAADLILPEYKENSDDDEDNEDDDDDDDDEDDDSSAARGAANLILPHIIEAEVSDSENRMPNAGGSARRSVKKCCTLL